MREIVVTGGGTGIGYAIAQAFTRFGDGRVTITGRRGGVLTEAAERLGARSVVFDAADPAEVSAALTRMPGRVDVLINNAGGNTDFDRASAAADNLAALTARWRANIEANLITAMLVTTALTPRIPDGGRVITIGSIAAEQGAGSYGAAKAALGAWNVDLAAALGPRGVTANVVSPGYTTGTEFFRDRMTQERHQQLTGATATGSAGTAADIASAVGFLASPATRHITGQTIHVNGGAHTTR